MTSPIRNAMTLPSFDAKWALARIMDGLKPHDLHYMTGLPESDCERIWAVYTALTEPQGEGPSDAELLNVAATAIDPYGSCGISVGEYEAETESAVEVYGSELIAFARVILARWGHPAPVPVSERLPGPVDCTAQGWCWAFYRGFATWTLETPLGQDGKHTGYTHWLPAHALPLPQGQSNQGENNV